MQFDAVILAGGRSSRLGGVPKDQLMAGAATLLECALAAARGASRVVVVGPEWGSLPSAVLRCREDPPFAGPAAAIATGLAALASAAHAERVLQAPLTLVLACDMPRSAGAVDALLAALDALDDMDAMDGFGALGAPDPLNFDAVPGVVNGWDGAVAVSEDGRIQPLVGLYGTAALQQAVDAATRSGSLQGGSVFGLLASLELQMVPVPPGSTDDVDTWDDASALGVSVPGGSAARQHSTVEANGEKPG